jgi:hypothetical protein
MEAQQVMGPRDDSKELSKMAPKFLFTGENAGKFMREFPFVAEYFGVTEAFDWEDDQELDDAGKRKNVLALAVLRQYISEDVLQIITEGEVTRASVLMKALRKMFLTQDARTKLQVERELLGCDMKLGEGLVPFLGRINKLINELITMGDMVTEKRRIITIVARLRPALREVADEKVDREPDLSYQELVQYLMGKQRNSVETGPVEAGC